MNEEIKKWIEREMQEAWDKMGDTGNDKYFEDYNEENYYFGRYRALEDLEWVLENQGKKQ